MKKILLLVALVLFNKTCLSAQERYRDSLFAKTTRQSFTYFQKSNEALGVDVFSPQGDRENARPLLIYVHGGGFSGGARDEAYLLKFCETFAHKGFVAATMSYSLVMKGKSFDCDQASPNKIATFRSAANDIARATAYFIEHYRQLGIDTNKIVLLGSSAGAEAVLHAAYWNAAKTDTSGHRILSETFRYAGLVSMAGALISPDFVTEKTAIPSQFFHGTCDNLVPYTTAAHHYCEAGDPGYLLLFGANTLAERLKSLGKPYYLVTACGGGHEWAGLPIAQNIPEITDFLCEDVLQKHTLRQIHLILPAKGAACTQYPGVGFCR